MISDAFLASMVCDPSRQERRDHEEACAEGVDDRIGEDEPQQVTEYHIEQSEDDPVVERTTHLKVRGFLLQPPLLKLRQNT